MAAAGLMAYLTSSLLSERLLPMALWSVLDGASTASKAGPAGPAGSHLDYFGLRSGRRSTSGRNGSNGCIHSTPQESQEVTGILVLSEMF